MFGISWGEFCVIFLVAVIVVPARNWPDVARFVARCVRAVRQIIWRITDASEQIKAQIEMERPIDEMLGNITDDVLGEISMHPRNMKRTSRGRAKK